MDLDLLNEFWKRTEQEQAFRSHSRDMREARPFSLDAELGEVIGKLAYGPGSSDKMLRRFTHAARLPYPVMWLEHDHDHIEQFGDTIFGKPTRTGWILRELELGIEGPTYMVHRVSRVMNDSDGVERASLYPIVHIIKPSGGIPYHNLYMLDANPHPPGSWQNIGAEVLKVIHGNPTSVAMAWGKTDEILRNYEFHEDDKHARLITAGADTKVDQERVAASPLYGTSGVMLAPRFLEATVARAQADGEDPKQAVLNLYWKAAQDQFGDLRFVVTALALLNEVPVRFVPYKPSGHIRAGGRLKPYMASSVVTLEVPATRRRIREIRDHLKAAGDTHSKRRHEVRGHWRHADKLPETHPERWERFEDRDGRLRFRTWIPNHARGDASLGWVRQTYDVVHGRGPIPGVKGVQHGIA